MNLHAITALLLSAVLVFAAAPSRAEANDAGEGRDIEEQATENAFGDAGKKQAKREKKERRKKAKRKKRGDGQDDAGQETATEEDVLSVEEILATEPQDSDYQDGQIRKCISRRIIRNIEPLDARHMIIKERGGGLWLNRYSTTCIGPIQRSDIPMFTTRSGSSFLCDGDQLFWVDSLGFGARVSCRIGRFEQISEEQAEALRVAYERRRETERAQRRRSKGNK